MLCEAENSGKKRFENTGGGDLYIPFVGCATYSPGQVRATYSGAFTRFVGGTCDPGTPISNSGGPSYVTGYSFTQTCASLDPFFGVTEGENASFACHNGCTHNLADGDCSGSGSEMTCTGTFTPTGGTCTLGSYSGIGTPGDPPPDPDPDPPPPDPKPPPGGEPPPYDPPPVDPEPTDPPPPTPPPTEQIDLRPDLAAIRNAVDAVRFAINALRGDTNAVRAAVNAVNVSLNAARTEIVAAQQGTTSAVNQQTTQLTSALNNIETAIQSQDVLTPEELAAALQVQTDALTNSLSEIVAGVAAGAGTVSNAISNQTSSLTTSINGVTNAVDGLAGGIEGITTAIGSQTGAITGVLDQIETNTAHGTAVVSACGVAPACTGDPVRCALLAQSHLARCVAESEAVEWQEFRDAWMDGDTGEDELEEPEDSAGLWAVADDNPAQFDASGFAPSGCPLTGLSVSVGPVPIDFASTCSYLEVIGALFVAMAYLGGIAIVYQG